MSDLRCPVCGSAAFHDRAWGGRVRPNAICAGCRADERARILWMMVARHGFLRPGPRVLHLAPEPALHARFRQTFGDGYDPVDLSPELFPDVPGIRRFDLLDDAPRLASGSYDLVLHSHVMEHVPGNVTAVLFHLHRALTAGGMQICCIPIARGRCYEEDLSPVGEAERTVRFGQGDHVRRFGEHDLGRTLGMLFRLPDPYDMTALFTPAELTRAAVPEAAWTGWTPHTTLALRKDNLLLA